MGNLKLFTRLLGFGMLTNIKRRLTQKKSITKNILSKFYKKYILTKKTYESYKPY